MTPKPNHRWPPLFKKASGNKISTWQIWVEESTIFTRSGFVGHKMRETKDVIKAGKNLGKKNETSPHDQAILEAQSKVEKQIDRGYVFDVADAKAGIIDREIQGGYYPMLAHSYEKHAAKIVFPCFVQPKLDGLRATYHDGRFFSRMRKPFPELTHLSKALADMNLGHLKLDGELYNHDYRENFEDLISAVKKNGPNTKDVQYHLYDVNIPGDYAKRLLTLEHISALIGDSAIRVVETRYVKTPAELVKAYEDFMEQGYEGAMLRNRAGEYLEQKRSYDLQKLKEFQDDEFKVVGISEGRGSLTGHAAAFVCVIDDEHGKRQFEAKLKGKNVTEFLKRCFEDPRLWKGKKLTVQYQGFTRKNRVPRFPVGLRFREDGL